MAVREELVTSAVQFLQDPSVSTSPIENRVAFLQSKNLTQEEIDAALARAGGESSPQSSNFTNYAPSQVTRQSAPPYTGYQQQWQQQPPPLPKRDWRDWFIMATVVGGVGYGAYVVAKRYIYPMIAPPTTPQLEQDKQAIDESFEKAFSLLDQLAKDTKTLKAAEQARTERLDTALTEVENVISDLKNASKRREDESRRISDEVRGLKDLIPKAIDGQKEATDNRLRELTTELKSLKTLMGQRMNPTSSNGSTSSTPVGRTSATPNPNAYSGNVSGTNSTDSAPKPASVSTSGGTETVASSQARGSSPFGPSGLPNRAAIPAWQLAANKTVTNPATTPTSNSEATTEVNAS